MRRSLLVLLITLLSLCTYAQGIRVTYEGGAKILTYFRHYVYADSGLYAPHIMYVTPGWDSLGLMEVDYAGNFHFHNGIAWQTVTPGGGTVTSISTTNPITGGPITTTGTIGFNPAFTNTFTATQAFSAGLTSTTGAFSTPLSSVNIGSLTGAQVGTSGLVNNSVTYGKMQAISGNSLLLGSSASGTAVSEIILGTGISMSGSTLNAAGTGGTVTSVATDGSLIGGPITTTGTLGLNPAFTNTFSATEAFSAGMTATTGSFSTPLTSANIGSLTGGQVGTSGLANNVVTYAKMQAISGNALLLGSSASGTAVSEITLGTGVSITGSTLNASGSGGTVTNIATTVGQLTGGPITTTGTLGLATAGTAGTYGSATQVPVYTTDAYGRIASTTNTTIAGVVPGGAAGGDLQGTYPNPTLLRQLAPTAVKNSNYTAVVNDFVTCDNTSGSFTVTLPAAPADKSIIGIKTVVESGTNTITIAAGGSDVFNVAGGGTSLTIKLLFQGYILQYKASTGIWYAIANDMTLGSLDGRFAPISITGTVTSVNISGNPTFSVTGGPITTSGTISFAPSGATTPSTQFLRGDNTWAIPSETGVTSVSGTANQIASTGGTTPVLSIVTNAILPGAPTIASPGNSTQNIVTTDATQAISNKTTATQTINDNSTKVTNTAYVDQYAPVMTSSVTVTTLTANSANAERRQPIYWSLSAQASNITIANPTGSWADGQILFIMLMYAGSPSGTTITLGANFKLPTGASTPTAAASQGTVIEAIYNVATTHFWVVPALAGYN